MYSVRHILYMFSFGDKISLHVIFRTEMQQMYEDVTQHLEQQSDSHQYLEKLRLENERVALQEKERQVYIMSPYTMAACEFTRECKFCFSLAHLLICACCTQQLYTCINR